MAEDAITVKELSGRHHSVSRTPDTSVTQLAAIVAPLLGCTAERVQLVFGGRVLAGDELVSDVPAGAWVMALVRFALPARLRDGACHPFSLNGMPIGGDLRDDVAPDVGQAEFAAALESLPAQEGFAGTDRNAPDVDELTLEVGREVPECLRHFLGMDSRQFSKLAFNPIVPLRADWTASFRVLREANDRVLVCFLIDHQGCCYWYLDLESLDVFVNFGGVAFADGSYLTSRSLWRFLCEYAIASRE